MMERTKCRYSMKMGEISVLGYLGMGEIISIISILKTVKSDVCLRITSKTYQQFEFFL